MYKLDVSKLKPGDIILERYPDDAISQKIMEHTQGNYSHVLLYLGNWSIIEAGNTVKAGNPQLRLYSSKEDVKILRVKQDFNNTLNIDSCISYVRSVIGMEYSTSEAYRIINPPENTKYPNRHTCTRLVAKAYELAGLPIVEKADYCTPKEIEESKYLETVENVILNADDYDIKFSQESNILEKQSIIEEVLLEKCREIIPDSDIQTFPQLTKATYDKPNKIEAICQAFHESGYLDLWKEDMESYPYFYDSDLFIKEFKEKSLFYAKFILSIIQEQIKRFIHNLCVHETNIEINGENCYERLMICHYENLLDWVKKRYMTALQVINQCTISQEILC